MSRPAPLHPFMSKLPRRAARLALLLVLLLWLAWTSLTLLFANLQPEGLRQGLAGTYLLWLLIAGFGLRPRRRRLPALVVSGLVVTAAYLVQSPSNDREWVPELAVAATAEIEGDRVLIHGVRNFHYRAEHDFDVRWEPREYDLSQLRTLDLFMSFWGPVDYCHTIISFGFEDGSQLAASVEVRKERGEEFSTFGGLFRMYELSYIFADEQDIIALRTTHRGEDVYLYRLRADPERLRALFLSYVEFADRLSREPAYYDVLANSCGVNIMHRVDDIGVAPWIGTEALLNGYWDRRLFERGAIDGSRPFEELRALSHINEAAIAADGTPDFSARIRAALPPAPVWVDAEGGASR